jgi:hypothetical protein
VIFPQGREGAGRMGVHICSDRKFPLRGNREWVATCRAPRPISGPPALPTLEQHLQLAEKITGADMNTTGVLLSLLFGAVGMGYLMYGKRMAEFVPIIVGMALMIVPYFFANNLILTVVCVGLMAAPFVRRGE